MPQIILASSSTYRKQLLSRLNLAFNIISPDVNETSHTHESPQQLCERLSRAKAQAVSTLNPAKIVIGSDQVASLNGTLLGKPGNKLRATQQLQSCSANSVDFFTGLCLQRGETQLFHLAHTQVKFRDLSTLEINSYLEAETPWDCAGSFKAEGLGICLFESIDSQDPTDLIGLPLIALSRMLREFGVNPLTPS
ncbi:MAG TPA: Maf family nucleotide pyrophosphatase [Cellvibrionaceae bacterium]